MTKNIVVETGRAQARAPHKRTWVAAVTWVRVVTGNNATKAGSPMSRTQRNPLVIVLLAAVLSLTGLALDMPPAQASWSIYNCNAGNGYGCSRYFYASNAVESSSYYTHTKGGIADSARTTFSRILQAPHEWRHSPLECVEYHWLEFG